MIQQPLSRRETEVLELTAVGLTNQEVAARLHLSVHAVKFHLSGIYRKFGVANRTAATAIYLARRNIPESTELRSN